MFRCETVLRRKNDGIQLLDPVEDVGEAEEAVPCCETAAVDVEDAGGVGGWTGG